MGDFAAVFAWQGWEMGEPRQGCFFFFFFFSEGGEKREPVTCREDPELEGPFAYSEGFAVTERAGKCIDISVHLSVSLW